MKIKNTEYNIYSLFILVGLFSFFFNYYYGFKGINLIDSFQSFDAGYRVLKGDIPFKDYYSRDGAVLDIIQAFFFRVFGINWTSFVINSSIINSLFALFIFKFGLKYNLKLYESFTYSIISGILLYPPAGTPQIDHHSLALSFIIFFIFLEILIKKKLLKYLIFIPFFYSFVFFIKPVPTIFFIIITILFILFCNQQFIKKKLFFFVAGTIFSYIFFYLITIIYNIPIQNIYDQLVNLSFYSGTQRLTFSNLENLIFSTFKIKYIFFLLFPLISILFINPKKNKKIINEIFLFFSLLFIIIIHESYTANQAVTLGFLSIFSILLSKIIVKKKLDNDKVLKIIIALLILVITLRLIRLDIVLGIFIIVFLFLSKYLKIFKKNVNLILIYSILLTFFYFNKVITNRFWLDIFNPNWKSGLDSRVIDDKLKGLIWLSNNQKTKEEVKEIKNNIEYLKNLKQNYIVITHVQIYSVLLQKKNFSPVKYWWNNQTYPENKTLSRKKFDDFFIKKINKNNIKKIIILDDVKNKYTGNFKIEEFEWLKNCSKKNNEKKIDADIYDIYKTCFN